MTNQGLKSTVLRILREPGIAKMNFQLGALLVNGARFALVARAIEEDKIECRNVAEFKSQGKDELAPGMTVEARYDIALNAMMFPDANYGNNNGGEERTIVHEATHAMFDLYAPFGRKTRTLAIEDEAAAVLAEAFYIKLCSKPVGGFKMMADGPQDEAFTLAGNMMAQTGNFEQTTAPYMLKREETEALRKAVAKDWRYTKYTDADGRPTDARGARYIYNGVVKCFKTWSEGK